MKEPEEKIKNPPKKKGLSLKEFFGINKTKKEEETEKAVQNFEKDAQNFEKTVQNFEKSISFIEDDIEYYGKFIIVDYIIYFVGNPSEMSHLPYTENYFSIPLFSISKIVPKQENKFYFEIHTKDKRKLHFKAGNYFFYENIEKYAFPVQRIGYYEYAFFFKNNNQINYKVNGWTIYDLQIECLRMGIGSNDKYRLTEINKDFALCETYPPFLIVPKNFTDENLSKCASFRSLNRFPVLCYYYKETEGCLWRSSQCLSGIKMKSSDLEGEYFREITQFQKGLKIYDCRGYVAAMANSLKGAGVERAKNYYNCTIEYCDIDNIHAVKTSMNKCYQLSTFDSNKKFLSQLESTKWMDYISLILKSSIDIAQNILNKMAVLVHCSDGWDRTAQVCSVAQLILDPYYRTIEGFCVLIEKEWVSFGHQFAVRNGITFEKSEKKKNSPVFTQFLHTVYQILIQFPTAFEFRENMLLFISDEIYSNKYGTFLCNSEKERAFYKIKEKTVSLWSEIIENREHYLNPLYYEKKTPVFPSWEPQKLVFWYNFFYKYQKSNKRRDYIEISSKKENQALKEMFELIREKDLVKNLSKETIDYVRSKI